MDIQQPVQQQPVQPVPVVTRPPQNSWKIIAWVIIGILVLSGVSYGAYYVFKKQYTCWPYCPGMTDQDRENIKKSALEAETANWQTYKNDIYGFEVKYPIKIGDIEIDSKKILSINAPTECNSSFLYPLSSKFCLNISLPIYQLIKNGVTSKQVIVADFREGLEIDINKILQMNEEELNKIYTTVSEFERKHVEDILVIKNNRIYFPVGGSTEYYIDVYDGMNLSIDDWISKNIEKERVGNIRTVEIDGIKGIRAGVSILTAGGCNSVFLPKNNLVYDIQSCQGEAWQFLPPEIIEKVFSYDFDNFLATFKFTK